MTPATTRSVPTRTVVFPSPSRFSIGGQGTAQRAREHGAFVITPPSLGVGMLEFHQLDRMVEAGRLAARALLDATGGDLFHAPHEET